MGIEAEFLKFSRFETVLNGLNRMERLMDVLDNPQRYLKAVHVAGTNGKGSVCRFVETIFEKNGYSTGVFTSPYLEKFNERIRFSGTDISDEELEFHGGRVLSAALKLRKEDVKVTVFDLITATAFCYFREKNPDIAIIETGLGGRHDSTNVLKAPLLSIITSVEMDHTDRLGASIKDIAREKAGIIKHGCPIIFSAKNKPAADIIEKEAERLKACISDMTSLTVPDGTISIFGRHQLENAAIAVEACRLLSEKGFEFKEDLIRRAMVEARNPGRLEVLSEKPRIIVDGCHNAAGAKAFAESCTEIERKGRRLIAVSIMAEKDVAAMIAEFSKLDADFVAFKGKDERSCETADIEAEFSKHGRHCFEAKNRISDIIEISKGRYRSVDYEDIFFAGSLYFVGEVRKLIREQKLR